MNLEKIAVVLKEELAQLHEDILQRHEQAGQVATGRTKASFEHYLTSSFSGVLVAPSWVGTLEKGRGPARANGVKGDKQEFIEGLKVWILARNLDYGGTTEGLERLAKFFRWYINQFGNKMYQEGRQEDIFDTPVEEFQNRLSKRITILFESEITNEIFSNNDNN